MPWFRSVGVLIVLASCVDAADWPQWLGPRRDGSTPEKVAPWKDSLKVLWRVAIGEGNSGPVVADGRVFLHTKVKGELKEQLDAFDARTGKPLWERRYDRPELKTLYGNGPRATPAFAGKRIYTYGLTGIVTCFNVDDGEQVWQVDAAKEFMPPRLVFGASCSPLVEGNAVLINVGGKGAGVVAFDRDTGKVLWKNLDDGASYASPIVFGKGDKRQTVFLTQQGVASLDPADGQLRWRFPFKDAILESSTTPVRSGKYIVASSITLGTVGLELHPKEAKAPVSQVWKNPNLTCYFSTPVPVGKDHLYAVAGVLSLNPFVKKKPTANLHCVDIHTGKELWTRPNVGTYHATLLRTGDDKLLMLEEKGDLVMFEPNPKEYRELARSKVCGQTWAHPAVADGRLYVRDGNELICVSLTRHAAGED
jgi:outer membrane protein assembly factor BamB